MEDLSVSMKRGPGEGSLPLQFPQQEAPDLSVNLSPASPPVRLAWCDRTKGIALILIIFFHFFGAYVNGRYPWPMTFSSFPGFMSRCAPISLWETLGCIAEGLLAMLFQRGPDAAGAFLVLSGFGLTYALISMGVPEPPESGWGPWYGKRFLRLFPLYWLAHLIYLVSPFISRTDPLDHRFILSLLGDRFMPAATMFYYLNPSWWFFGLLIQLYLVFPFLLRLLRALGPWRFLILSGLITLTSRYVLLEVLQAHGNYLQGAFFGARLWEFTAGMVFALLYRRHPGRLSAVLSSYLLPLWGGLLYTLGCYSYRPGITYLFSDALLSVGFSLLLISVARVLGRAAWLGSLLSLLGTYSYSLYLLHQPYMRYAGERLQGGRMITFVICGLLIVFLLALIAIPLEAWLNRRTGQWLSLRGPLSANSPQAKPSPVTTASRGDAR